MNNIKKKAKVVKITMFTLIFLGVLLIFVSRYGPESLKNDSLSGIGTGLTISVSLLLIIQMIKSKNKDACEEIAINLNDERMSLVKIKSIAIGGVVGLILTSVLLMISQHTKIEFQYAGYGIIFIQLVTIIIAKLYYIRRR